MDILTQVIRFVTIKQTRSFAAVLFRRVAGKTRKDPTNDETRELYLSLPQAQQFAIRQNLLQCLTNEVLPDVRNKIGDAVAELARQHSDEGMSRFVFEVLCTRVEDVLS